MKLAIKQPTKIYGPHILGRKFCISILHLSNGGTKIFTQLNITDQ